MDHARRTGEIVLRLYGWSAPTLSFGRNQRVCGDSGYDPDRLRDRGIAAVRRPTGGRSILHDREVTYSVTARDDALGKLSESYARINRLLIAGLNALGVEARVASTARALPPGPTPCFDHPSNGELVHAGRKLVGSAQWRQDSALLQHGSILVEDDQQVLAALLRTPIASHPVAGPATLRAALDRVPSSREVAAALFAAVCDLEDASASPMELDESTVALATDLAVHYSDERWTWRR